jgi:hypothetical protein
VRHLTLLETFAELEKLYESLEKELTEGKTMPYALIVLLDGSWKVYKGLDSELSKKELEDFLSDKSEYTEAKVIPSSDIYKYVKKSKKALRESLPRVELIDRLKALGKRYYFDKYSDEQLYRMWEKESAKKEEQEALKDFYDSKSEKPFCSECGCDLTDGGYCPVCDDGEEDLYEGTFDGTFTRSNWIPMSSTNTTTQQTASTPVTQSSNASNPNPTGKYIVTIMWDGNKFRARADDGIHGRANVAFPTALRNHNGQQYEVEDLTWNGKNYRAVGKIRPINSVSNTQNINENINKENFTMNFIETIAALDKLYESIDPALEKEEVLEEAVEDEVVDEEIPADEEIEVEDEAADTQLVLECSKCGALVIKPEAEVVTSDETDLVNAEETCQYCEEAEGYKVIGTFIPSEETAEITEGIFDKFKRNKNMTTSIAADEGAKDKYPNN